MNRSTLIASLCLAGMTGLSASAETRGERVDKITKTLAGGIVDNAQTEEVYTDSETGQRRATPRQLMRATMTVVDLDKVPARLALDVWSTQTGVPLVVNWAGLEAQGVDPTTPVTLKLDRVPAEQVLKLIISQINPNPISDEETLMLDIEQWYVRVFTKRDALRQSNTRMYFIGDLLMTIPNFDNAPGFDLNDALSNTSSGGSGSGTTGGGGNGGGGSPFGDDNDDREKEPTLSKGEQAELIADIIRDTIEPEIWRDRGGEYASVRYYRGMLIVKAPDFVHEQIGGSFGSSKTKVRRSTTGSNSSSNQQHRRSTPGNVGGVAPSGPKLVK